jgi:hypothetical protein
LIIKEVALDSKPSYYSVSRLKTYSQCSEYFKKQYVDLDYVRDFSPSTLTGSLIHDALEFYYLGNSKSVIEGFILNGESSLINLKVVQESDMEVISTYLNEYAIELATLYKRASASYKGNDAIRTKSGDVPVNPTMTSVWKSYLKDSGLYGKKDLVDTFISDKNEGINFSVCDAYAEAYSLCANYTYPDMGTTIATELGISVWDKNTSILNNPVLMPEIHGGDDGIYLSGYIDLISKVGPNDDDILICDHKSGKEEFNTSTVLHNVQLLSYVYAYEVLTGIKAKYIGINNIRAGTLVKVETPNDEFVRDILLTLFANHNGIKNSYFTKKRPESYSPCLAMFGKVCPYLGKCWPESVPQ